MIDCVTDVSEPLANVSVYAVPIVPLIPTVLKVATPLKAVAVAVPTTIPLSLTVIVTTELLSVVTVFPDASWIATTGCVVNADPLAAPAADVESASRLAVPAVGVIDCVTDVSEPLANVSVYAVPSVPLMPTSLKVATPLEAVAVAVPTTVPPELTVIVTTELLSVVTVFPDVSWIATTGCVVNAAPLVAPAADVVKPSSLAIIFGNSKKLKTNSANLKYLVILLPLEGHLSAKRTGQSDRRGLMRASFRGNTSFSVMTFVLDESGQTKRPI